MRFSAAFNRPLPRTAGTPERELPPADGTPGIAAAPPGPGTMRARTAATPPQREWPADLDQRVRLVGEW